MTLHLDNGLLTLGSDGVDLVDENNGRSFRLSLDKNVACILLGLVHFEAGELKKMSGENEAACTTSLLTHLRLREASGRRGACTSRRAPPHRALFS
jgi:hypothetical protein